MGININELNGLRSDYKRVKGVECPEFYCPILNEFGAGPRGLMDGHILPRCVRSASRATVIQRADVDNKFGTVEAVLCEFLNRPLYEIEELYKKLTNLTITGSSGTPVQAFFPSKKAKPPYPRIDLTDEEGRVIAAPHVKVPAERTGEFNGPVQVEGEIVLSLPALIVSVLKSAHLALFKLLGYHWVFNEVGQYVGERLARLVKCELDAGAVKQLADELPRACFRMVDGGALAVDTIGSRLVMLHYDHFEGKCHPAQRGIEAWGISCLFKLNDCSFTFTLPFATEGQRLDAALNKYRTYLDSPISRHSVYTAGIYRANQFGWHHWAINGRTDGEICGRWRGGLRARAG
jgi:hypothetical protein